MAEWRRDDDAPDRRVDCAPLRELLELGPEHVLASISGATAKANDELRAAAPAAARLSYADTSRPPRCVRVRTGFANSAVVNLLAVPTEHAFGDARARANVDAGDTSGDAAGAADASADAKGVGDASDRGDTVSNASMPAR